MNLNGEFIFQQLIGSNFVRRKLSQILIAITVSLLNIHIVSGLSFIIAINPYIDFILQIAMSVCCSLNTGYLYDFVQRYQSEFDILSKYLITNYTLENYRFWKRIIIVTACLYLCIILTFIEVTNRLLFLYIFQYFLSFLIIEQFEQQRVQKWYQDYQRRPQIRVSKPVDPPDFMIESYMSPKKYLINANRSGSIVNCPRASPFVSIVGNTRRRKK